MRDVHQQGAVVALEGLAQDLAHQLRQHHPVQPGIARSATHGLEVFSGQLAAQRVEAGRGVAPAARPGGAGTVHPALADVEADIARAAVDHHHQFVGPEAQGEGLVAVEQAVHHLQLDEVIAGTGGTQAGIADQAAAAIAQGLGGILETPAEFIQTDAAL